MEIEKSVLMTNSASILHNQMRRLDCTTAALSSSLCHTTHWVWHATQGGGQTAEDWSFSPRCHERHFWPEPHRLGSVFTCYNGLEQWAAHRVNVYWHILGPQRRTLWKCEKCFPVKGTYCVFTSSLSLVMKKRLSQEAVIVTMVKQSHKMTVINHYSILLLAE